MRQVISALLAAATLAAPAWAQGPEPRLGGRARPEVMERSPSEAQASSPAQREQRFERREERREARQERRDDRQDFRRERRDDGQEFRRERRDDGQEFRRERRDDRQDLRNGDVGRGEFRRDRWDDRRDLRRDRWQDRGDFRRDRWDDRRDWNRGRWNGDRGWSQDWRSDPRYNWQDWRRNNRGFGFGRYYAPRGWNGGYRRFSLGVILSAPLFAQNYWLDDPYAYRLPPADGPYRWVRYYDDVLLVDIRDGRVLDVIHDFFWR